eukprot:scaffold112796_cov62-Attheya_sp.AAC.9
MVLDRSATNSGVEMDAPKTCQSLTTRLLFVGITVERSVNKTRCCLNPNTSRPEVVEVGVRNQ